MKIRLTDAQAYGLEKLQESVDRAASLGQDAPRWIGAREGVEGSTLDALARKGLAEVRWAKKPYRRLVGRITAAGTEELRKRREREQARLAAAADEEHDRATTDGANDGRDSVGRRSVGTIPTTETKGEQHGFAE